ncbi:NAC domain-containing protein 54-like [Tasmannia lanceolata]|uniref:NAC domain-containing protein 54-like n=1 Tax=Tasmannia lanceolata TaxID=3420 RepID=UPI004062F0B8
MADLGLIPLPLPPGFGFHPTEEHLLSYYLKNKLQKPQSSSLLHVDDVISEVNVYQYDPCDLPGNVFFSSNGCKKKRRWYCFTPIIKKRGSGSSSKCEKRKARGGFWKSKGQDRLVYSEKDGNVLGKRKRFVFYRRSSSRSCKSDWIMIEYQLVDATRSSSTPPKDSFAVCCVFLKPGAGKKVLKFNLGCHAPDNLTGTLNDGVETPRTHNASVPLAGEVVAQKVVDTEDEHHKFPTNMTVDPGDPVVGQPVDDAFQFSEDIPQQDPQIKSPDGVISTLPSSADDTVLGELIEHEILDGDFMELNDLLSPLPSGPSGSDDTVLGELIEHVVLEGDFMELNDLHSPLPGFNG